MTQSKKIAIKRSKAHPLTGSRKVGDSEPGEHIEVVVQLRFPPGIKDLPSMEELAAYLPHKRKHLTHEEFEKTHGAFPGDIAKVKAFAQEHHLKVEKVEPVHRLVTLTGTLKDLSTAFGVQFVNHQHPEHDTVFRTYEGEIQIPEELADIVEGVFGLENTPVFKPYIHNNKHNREESEVSLKAAFYPTQIAQFYNFPKDVTGEGQSIAIIQLGGGYERKYLEEYFNKLNIKMPRITDVLVAGGKNNPYTGPVTNKSEMGLYLATAEVYGDIEVAAAVAPGAEIVLYFAPGSMKGFLSAIKTAVHDKEHKNSVISISWGMTEPEDEQTSFTRAFNCTLHEAAVKGITVCCSSGDYGSSDSSENEDGLAHVHFPASSSWALACGGTRLFVQDNKIKKEIVWKQTLHQYKIRGLIIKQTVTASSGGGVSNLFKRPLYQVMAGVRPESVNPGNKTGRGVPDVAGNADKRSGYLVQINDEISPNGGTSLITPLYAGLVALVNQKLNAKVGFLHPFLYQAGKLHETFKDKKIKKEEEYLFNDITEGDNVTAKAGGYYAQQGWDACSGWGSINGENLLKALQTFKPPKPGFMRK